MRRIKLTKEERAIEAVAERGEHAPVSKTKFEEIAAALVYRRKILEGQAGDRAYSSMDALIKDLKRSR